MSKLLERVDAVFSSEYLEKHGYSYSPQQHQYAQRVAKTLLRGQRTKPDRAAPDHRTAITLLEAATGTGKTVGYLVPLLLHAAETGERVAISTFTLHLQDQILKKDLPRVLKIVAEQTHVKLNCARRKGIRNFVSFSDVEEIYKQKLKEQGKVKHDEEFDALTLLYKWSANSIKGRNSGLLSDFMLDHGLQQLPYGITEDDIGLTHSDDPAELETYNQHIVTSKDADVLLVTHAMLLRNNLYWMKLLDDDERQISAVTIDEADRIEDAAAMVYHRDVPLRRLHNLLETLNETFGGFSGSIKSAESTLEVIAKLKPVKQSYALIDHHSDGFRGALESTKALITSFKKPLNKLVNRVEAGEIRNKEAKQLIAEARDTINALTAFHDTANAKTVAESQAAISWSIVRAYPSLRVVPLYPGRLTARLWNATTGDTDGPPQCFLKAVILTSATLGVPGGKPENRFRDCMFNLGIISSINGREIHNVCEDLNHSFEPSDFGRAIFVLPDPKAPVPVIALNTPTVNDDEDSYATNPTWANYAASMILKASARGGRVLALTLSYKDTGVISEILLKNSKNVLVHRPGTSLRDYIDAFVSNKSSVWLTPAAWEGVDLPGMIDNLCITRLPFMPLDQLRSDAIAANLRAKGYPEDRINSAMAARRMNDTKRILLQGLGRGIRSSSDRCRIWIADSRFPLPENYRNLRDQKLEPGEQRIYTALTACVPSRFREGIGSSYPRAKVLLQDGNMYSPKG